MRKGVRAGGVSMAELMVAVAIFATAFLVLLGLFPLASRELHQAQQRLTYTYVAQQGLELARSAGFDAMASSTTDFGLYTVQVVVTDITPGALKSLRVVVSWSATGAVGDRSRHVELITYVAKIT